MGQLPQPKLMPMQMLPQLEEHFTVYSFKWQLASASGKFLSLFSMQAHRHAHAHTHSHTFTHEQEILQRVEMS